MENITGIEVEYMEDITPDNVLFFKNSRLACVTNSSDIEAIFKHIQQKWPSTPVLVAAFSIGA